VEQLNNEAEIIFRASGMTINDNIRKKLRNKSNPAKFAALL